MYFAIFLELYPTVVGGNLEGIGGLSMGGGRRMYGLSPESVVRFEKSGDDGAASLVSSVWLSDICCVVVDETIETEEDILLHKEQARQNARDEETTKIKLAITETTPIPINKASYTFGAIKKDARIRVEQDSNLVFKVIKRKLICEEFDKHLLQTDPTAKRLLVHKNRLIVKDGVLMRKYYGECGQVTHHQIRHVSLSPPVLLLVGFVPHFLATRVRQSVFQNPFPMIPRTTHCATL